MQACISLVPKLRAKARKSVLFILGPCRGFVFSFFAFLLTVSVLSESQPLAAQNSQVRIVSISFEGNQSISAGQLKLLMRMSQEGGEYFPGDLQADLRHVEKTYRDSGFLKVQLEAPDVRVQGAGEEKTAFISILVREGPRYATGTLAVKDDAKALAPETLMQLCPLQKGQPYSPVKAAQWQAKVEDSYRSMGYLRAHCPLREAVSDPGKTVDCTMECKEGNVYTVGQIGITGNSSLSPSEVKRRLLFSEGGIYNPEMLSLSIQFLNQAGRYEPISSSDVDIRIDDEKGVVDVSLRLVPRVR